MIGLDRDADFAGAEREEPGCLAVVWANESGGLAAPSPAELVGAARRATWRGAANRLSPDHVEWPIIEEVAKATRAVGSRDPGSGIGNSRLEIPNPQSPVPGPRSARAIILQRRSALGFDGRTALRRDRFLSMLSRLHPPAPPWDAIDWSPHVHLALFVHRVEGVVPGIYAYLRDDSALAALRGAMRPAFLWERIEPGTPLFLLVPLDCRQTANRLSCDQEIAAEGFFSLGMLARVEPALHERGEWFYRRLFWECGLIGQVLYLEAEAAGARATGIGCFYDDPVHEMLGLAGHAWQSLYHLAMGMPVEDARLGTEPGYEWE